MITKNEQPIEQYLKKYCENGWYVFPVKAGEKVPAIQGGYKSASNDYETVKAMFDSGTFNIGLALETSGLFAVDLDGDTGLENFLKLIGDKKISLPVTLQQKSPRGEHLLFRAPVEFDPRGQLAEKVDLKYRGYIVLEPSVVAYENGDSGEYKFTNQHKIAEAPAELLNLCQKQKYEPPPQRTTMTAPVNGSEDRYYSVALSNICKEISSTPNGARNKTLSISSLKVGGFVAAGGLDETTARESLLTAALACGLTENESRKTIDSGIKKGMQTPHVKPDSGRNGAARPAITQGEKQTAQIEIPDFELVLAETVNSIGNLERGIPTGKEQLDILFQGFLSGELSLIGSRPSVGKTTLLINFMHYAAIRSAKSVVFFSLEMPNKRIGERLLLHDLGISKKQLVAGEHDDQVGKVVERLSNAKERIITYDNVFGLFDITNTIERIQQHRKLDAVYIDYITLIRAPKTDSRYTEVGLISRTLKTFAMRTGLPIITACQLGRQADDRVDGRPRLSDLRESGNLEQDADVVMLLHPQPEGVVLLDLAKNRNGETGQVYLGFNKSTFTFSNRDGMRSF